MGSHLTVLCYHDVVGSWASPADPRRATSGFEQQLRLLARWANVVPLGDALQRLRSRRPLPARAVAITFDDGYRDSVTVAAPLLRALHLPATFFLSSGFLARDHEPWWERLAAAVRLSRKDSLDWEGVTLPLSDFLTRHRAYQQVSAALKQGDWASRDRTVDRLIHDLDPFTTVDLSPLFLDWEGARELVRAGFEIGSHSVSHPIMSRESLDEQRRQLAWSKEMLTRELDTEVELFAYPNGTHHDYDAVTLESLTATGHLGAVTTRFGWNDTATPPFEIRRVLVEPYMGGHGLVRSIANPAQAWIRHRTRRAIHGAY